MRSTTRVFGSHRPLAGCALTTKTCSRTCFRDSGESFVATRSANIGTFTRPRKALEDQIVLKVVGRRSAFA
jgi:hypothetical protein